LMGIPAYAFLKAGFQAESAPGSFGDFAPRIDPWTGETLEYSVWYPWTSDKSSKTAAWYYDVPYGPAGAVGTVAGVFITANPYLVRTNRDHATSTAPASQLSSASGSLFGYGYEQEQQAENSAQGVPH
jgi:hypothetical protein